jgi:uncharacterized RDD family membrane protein YckC
LIPAIDTIITAETPEGIEIAIRPAGFAVRCTAFLIDACIRVAILAACASALGVGGHFGGGLLLIVLFIINWLYPVIFELTAAAATPGKRIMGLYVLMANGLPITPAGCLIRNLPIEANCSQAARSGPANRYRRESRYRHGNKWRSRHLPGA